MLKLQYKAWLSACALLLLPLAAHAAGLGQIKILSSLGQPLHAEIDLSATSDELSTLSIKLASPDAFRKANIDYSAALMGVRLSVEQRADGTPYVKVISTRAINDTFIDMLVELDWSQGQLLREYTALIDPPDYTPPVPASAAAPVAPSQPAVEQPTTQVAETTAPQQPTTTPLAQAAPPVVPVTTPSETTAAGSSVETTSTMAATPTGTTSVTEVPATETAAASEPAATTTQAASGETAAPATTATAAAPTAPQEYTVKSGDTLTKIANATKPDGVTVEQMLVALFQANPDAFSGKNMNRLNAGKILREPTYDEITAIAPDDATKEIHVQAANWNAYRKKIAEAAAVTPAQESQSAAGGKIATVEQAQPAQGASKEIVKLSKGETSTPAERERALQEEATAKQKALDEANMRVAMLEKQVSDLQHLLQLKGQLPPATASAAAPATAKSAATSPPTSTTSAPASAASMAQPKPAVAPVVAAQPAASGSTAAPAPVEQPKPKKPKVVAPPPSPPSLLQMVLGNPLYLAVLAIVVLGAAGGGYWWWSRRGAAGGTSSPKKKVNKSRKEAAEEEDDGGDELKLMHKTVAMPAVAAASAPASTAASDSDVDPIAEAELYLNFGRDAQAEEVLKEALKANPQHEAAQIKLLQIYANRKDKAAFEKAARAYHEQAGARTNWLSVAAMGYALDPANSLYADGANVDASALALGSASQDHGAMDLDFDLLSSGTAPAPDVLDIGGGDSVADMEKTSFIRPSDLNQGVMDITGDLGQGAPAIPDFSVPELDEDGLAKTDIAIGGLDAGHSIDFNTDVSPAAPASETHDRGPLIPDFKIDFNELSNDLSSAAAVASNASPDISLSDISLSLDMPSGGLATGDSATSDVKDAHWFDVQTKFDLAKAYQEMGDNDGAREILQEVVRDGDNTQRTEAQALLDSIA